MGVNVIFEITLKGDLPAWVVEDLRKAAEATAAAAKTVGKTVGKGAEIVYDAAKDTAVSEYRGYKSDLMHIGRLDLHKIRPETEVLIAKSLRDALDPSNPVVSRGIGKDIKLPIGKLDLPGNLSVRIWAKDVNDLSKGKVEGVMLNYELFRR